MNDIRSIYQYLKTQLKHEDAEIYLDYDDYVLINQALEECLGTYDRLVRKRNDLVKNMEINSGEFGHSLDEEKKRYNDGIRKGIDILNEEIPRWLM